MFSLWIVAQQAPPESPGLLVSLMPLFLIFFIFWFIVWKPQAKQRQQHQTFVNNLKVGDEVVTAGGIFGKVVTIENTAVQLEIARGTKIKVLRQQLQQTQPGTQTEKNTDSTSETKDKSDKNSTK